MVVKTCSTGVGHRSGSGVALTLLLCVRRSIAHHALATRRSGVPIAVEGVVLAVKVEGVRMVVLQCAPGQSQSRAQVAASAVQAWAAHLHIARAVVLHACRYAVLLEGVRGPHHRRVHLHQRQVSIHFPRGRVCATAQIKQTAYSTCRAGTAAARCCLPTLQEACAGCGHRAAVHQCQARCVHLCIARSR